MPAKKRTDQTKRTPSTSPTASTSHTSDQHHRLRHTGPSITTRSTLTAASSSPPTAHAHAQPTPGPESPLSQEGSREKKPPADAPPGARTPLTKFMYVLLFSVLLLLGWYLYGMITLFERLKEEVGWWGIVVGHSGEGYGPESDRSGREGRWAEAEKDGSLKGSLNALADALGIPPIQVASAVKPLIPQASLVSIASKSEETGGSEAVRVLFEDTTQNGGTDTIRK